MKIMICGKGGTGKSALSVLMARLLSGKYKVYLIDSDESNELLPRMLGTSSPRPLAEYLGGKKKIFKIGEINMVKALETASGGIKPGVLPEEYVSRSSEGIGLLTIGKVRKLGEGCACPFNFLTKVLLKNLRLDQGEIVLVDTDAGIEHIGRGVEEGSDGVLAVADPTVESLTLAKILKDNCEAGAKDFWLVLNKVTPEISDILKKMAKRMGLEVTGVVRYDPQIFRSSLEGSRLMAGEALNDVKLLLEHMNLL